ncbi:hypothetical protein H4217_005334 [Coemansia sp. RSA 1939]|nr:hypothetical protein H4217_005334 [Coemansia sp. RSA 1939]KAJ2593328.1 hypothetical protein EV177_008576 [Coemansia sp. RSA 1804]
MNQGNRVRQNDEYSISEWYSATRDSTGTSVMTENPNIVPYQSPNNSHPQRQRVEMRVLNPQISPVQQYGNQRQRLPPQSNTQWQQRDTIDPVAFYANGTESVLYSAQPHGRNHPGFAQEQYDNYPPHQNSYQNSYQNTQHNGYQTSNGMRPRNDSSVVVLDNLPEGVTSAARDESSIYQTQTSHTSNSTQPMGVTFGGIHSKPSRQELLADYGTHNSKDEASVFDPHRPSSAYNPPMQPQASAAQYSTASQLSRDKSVKDRYKQRKVGGDSGMGECCEPCCGGCMRCFCCSCCTCCSACGCIGPLLAWGLLIGVIVGIGLGLYFNWDKITNAVKNIGDNANPTETAAAAAAAAATPAAAAPAARDLFNLANTSAGSFTETHILPPLL